MRSVLNHSASLIVAPAEKVAELRREHPTTPILALVDIDNDNDRSAALSAIQAGADYVLPSNASKDLIEATFLAAERAADAKKMARSFEAALENVAEAVEICDADARFVWVNRAFEEMTGYAREETTGKTPAQLLRSNFHTKSYYEEMWRTISKEKQEWRGGLVGRRADGSVVAELALVKPILDPSGSGEIEHFIAVKHFAPSTARKEDADAPPANVDITALLSSERSYRAMMTAARDAMLVSDWETAKFIDANPAACEMFGYSVAEFRELTGRMLHPPGTPDKLGEALRESGSAFEHRQPMIRKDGTRFWGAVSMTTYVFLGRRQTFAVVRDVSDEVAREEELKKAHQQVLHSSRLAALGQMAAGIAHEINNPLQYILGGLEELRQLRPGDERGESHREQIFGDMIEGAERIRNVTRALLPFSRVGVNDTELNELVDLNEVANWAVRVTANEMKHRAHVELRLDANVPNLIGCRVHIGQLITNLLTNAAHAIEEGAEAKNRITVTTAQLSDGRVELVVEDTGCGIPESVRERIFEPFFTMKSSDMGTGLGLALCAEIALRHKGTLDVESTVGVGSRFKVTFGRESLAPSGPDLVMPPPARTVILSEAPATAATQQPQAAGPAKGAGAKQMRVLVIDDEEPLLRAYRRFLKDLDVVTIASGAAALAELGPDSQFDAIICDLMMPNVDGPLVHAHVLSNAPHLAKRMIFCSGGAFTPRVREFLQTIENPVLDKPVTPKDLRASLLAMRDAAE